MPGVNTEKPGGYPRGLEVILRGLEVILRGLEVILRGLEVT